MIVSIIFAKSAESCLLKGLPGAAFSANKPSHIVAESEGGTAEQDRLRRGES